MPDQSKSFVVEADFPQDSAIVSSLFNAYAESLGIDLSFQDFANELSTLPGKYSKAEGGILLVARSSSTDEVIGCVAIRQLNALEVCEMKRLYVSPTSRGSGAGRKLLERALDFAKDMGYREVRLDTLSSMTGARNLYKRYGFEEIDAYYDTPIDATVFMALDLRI